MDLVDGAGNSGHAAGSAVQCCAAKSRYAKGKGVCPAELGLKVFGEMPWLKRRCLAREQIQRMTTTLSYQYLSTVPCGWVEAPMSRSGCAHRPAISVGVAVIGTSGVGGCLAAELAGRAAHDWTVAQHGLFGTCQRVNALWCGINTPLCPGCLRTESPTQEIQHPFHNSLPSTTTSHFAFKLSKTVYSLQSFGSLQSKHTVRCSHHALPPSRLLVPWNFGHR